MKRKTVAEMGGEFLREIAALVGVFGVLEKALRNELTFELFCALTFTCLLILSAGIWIERER